MVDHYGETMGWEHKVENQQTSTRLIQCPAALIRRQVKDSSLAVNDR